VLQFNPCGHALDDLQQMRRRKEYHWVVFDKSIQEPKEILNDIRVIDEIIVSWEDLEGCFDKYFECALENRTEGVIAGAA